MSKEETKQPIQVARPEQNPASSPLQMVSGSKYEKFSNILTNEVANALCLASTEEDQRLQIEASLEAMAGLAPQDEAEGMLVAQMVALHRTAMDCLRRVALPGMTFEGQQQNLNFANKLSRTYALHMEALDKHRGKGQQKVTVEHVHVHQGGQAIVVTVERGVGVALESEEQVHANAIAHAPEQEVRSAFEAKRKAMSQRRNEER